MRNTRNIVKISEVNKHVDTGPALNYSVVTSQAVKAAQDCEVASSEKIYSIPLRVSHYSRLVITCINILVSILFAVILGTVLNKGRCSNNY